MSVVQRPDAVARSEVSWRAAAPAAWRGVLAVAKLIALLVSVLAIVGIMSGMARLNLMLVVASWILLSLAATGVFALSRLGARR